MKPIQDRVVLIIAVGTVSAAVANGFGYITKLLYPGTPIMPEVAAQLFVHGPRTLEWLTIIFGNIWSFIVGGLHAAGLVSTLDITGWRHIFWKSLAVTNVGWLLGVGILFRALDISSAAHSDPVAIILFYAAHLVYLTAAAILARAVGEPRRDSATDE